MRSRNSVLIIGNGFDIDLGLKSRYSDFAKSQYWENNIEHATHSSNSLLQSLINAKEKSDWFDIEQAMLNYVLEQMKLFEKSNYEYDSFDDDRQQYLLVCKQLKEYLQDESAKETLNMNSVAMKIIESICNSDMFTAIYSFNYTDLDSLLDQRNLKSHPKVFHVHGSLAENDDIILGVESDKVLPKQYNFLYKTSSDYYHSNNIYEDLMKANEVIFFGHSIDGMDFKYFQKFFQNASSEDASNYKKRYIRIFTGDSASKINIEYNLRTKGIDPFDLYRLNDLDFIYTIECERGNEHEKSKLNRFIIHLNEERNENMIPQIKIL